MITSDKININLLSWLTEQYIFAYRNNRLKIGTDFQANYFYWEKSKTDGDEDFNGHDGY